MGIGWIRRQLKLTGYDGGWDDLEKWFDREPEVDGRGTMSECSRTFWRYWTEMPESGGAYEEVDEGLGEMMLEHWSNYLWEDYEEAKEKVKETVDGEEGFEAEREADAEEEESGNEEERKSSRNIWRISLHRNKSEITATWANPGQILEASLVFILVHSPCLVTTQEETHPGCKMAFILLH